MNCKFNNLAEAISYIFNLPYKKVVKMAIKQRIKKLEKALLSEKELQDELKIYDKEYHELLSIYLKINSFDEDEFFVPKEIDLSNLNKDEQIDAIVNMYYDDYCKHNITAQQIADKVVEFTKITFASALCKVYTQIKNYKNNYI